MNAQSLFSKKNIQSQQPGKSGGILEELNLPPELTAFIRKNSRTLQIGLACTAILILGWIFYDNYTEMQEKKGASLLTTGLQAESTEQRVQILDNVINDYGRTDAARWARLELAHLDYVEEKPEDAAAKYKEIVDTLPGDNSLTPLAIFNLAQSYEQAGLYDQAIEQYILLKSFSGFTNQAFWGLGRIYMAKQDPVKAREAYEGLLDSLTEASNPLLRSQAEAKLTALNTSQAVIVSQPETSEK